eukprot:symbB.v1.2.002314.t1/scaffold107.1/size327550/30
MVSMLRPLRLIGKTSSVRLIIEALLAAIPTLINMSMMSAMFFLGFALLFVGFFKGALYRCSLDPLGAKRRNRGIFFPVVGMGGWVKQAVFTVTAAEIGVTWERSLINWKMKRT